MLPQAIISSYGGRQKHTPALCAWKTSQFAVISQALLRPRDERPCGNDSFSRGLQGSAISNCRNVANDTKLPRQ